MEEQKRAWAQEVEALTRQVRNQPQLSREPLSRLLDSLTASLQLTPDDPELVRLHARARFAWTVLQRHSGQYALAEEGLLDLIQEYTAREETHRVAECLEALSIVEERKGDKIASLRRLEECFHLLGTVETPAKRRAGILLHIGVTQAQMESHEAALNTLGFAEELMPDDSPEFLGVIRTNQALLHRTLGDEACSHALLNSAVELLEPLGTSFHLLNALLEQTASLINADELAAAQQQLNRSRCVHDELGVMLFEPEQRLVAAQLALARGQYAEAHAELDAGMQAANPEQRIRLLNLQAEVAEAEQDLPRALRCLRLAHAEQLKLMRVQTEERMAQSRARIAATIDREQRHWLRDELRRARAEARTLTSRLDTEKCRLAAAVHDIHNPLSVVLLLGELASSSPETLQESARAIVDAARHMDNLVNDLLTVTAPPESAPQLHVSSIDMQPLVEAALRRYAPLAIEKQQKLKLGSLPDDARVSGDAKAFARIMDNLLSNAIKYTPRAGDIEVKVHREPPRMVLEVLDTGPGLSPDDLERVFIYPQILSATPTEGESQHGLGLVGVRRLVNAMGGRVHVENRLRSGARFVVELMLPTD